MQLRDPALVQSAPAQGGTTDGGESVMPDDLESRLTEDCYTCRRRINKMLRDTFGDSCPHCAARQQELDECARQIIADLVEYAECNDPGNPHIGKAKGFLSGGEG